MKLHCVSKIVPTFKLSVTLSNLNRFSNFVHWWKAYEICYKTRMTLSIPLYVCCYSTLGNKKIQIFCRNPQMCKMQTNCIFIAFNFVIHPQILIFSVFKIASCSLYWLQIAFFVLLFFFSLFTFVICGTGNSSQQTSLQCLSTVNMIFSNKDKILTKTHTYTQNTVIRIEELKLVHLKCNLFAFSSISAEYLQKLEFLISRGSVATCLRWGGYCRKVL